MVAHLLGAHMRDTSPVTPRAVSPTDAGGMESTASFAVGATVPLPVAVSCAAKSGSRRSHVDDRRAWRLGCVAALARRSTAARRPGSGTVSLRFAAIGRVAPLFDAGNGELVDPVVWTRTESGSGRRLRHGPRGPPRQGVS